MMVYKYWDSITKEDLEFSVGTKQNNWEVKEPFLHEGGDSSIDAAGRRASYMEMSTEYVNSSTYQQQSAMQRHSQVYGGGY